MQFKLIDLIKFNVFLRKVDHYLMNFTENLSLIQLQQALLKFLKPT